MKLKTAEQSITVTAEAAGIVDTSTAGISQLINSESVSNLPLPGRDYRDLANSLPPLRSPQGFAAAFASAASRATTAASP